MKKTKTKFKRKDKVVVYLEDIDSGEERYLGGILDTRWLPGVWTGEKDVLWTVKTEEGTLEILESKIVNYEIGSLLYL